MRNICAPSTIAYVTPAWTPCITNTADPHFLLVAGGRLVAAYSECLSILLAVKAALHPAGACYTLRKAATSKDEAGRSHQRTQTPALCPGAPAPLQ